VLQPGVPVNSFFVYQQNTRNGKPVYDANPLNMYVDQPTSAIPVACPAAPGCVGLYRPTGSSTTPTGGRITTPRRSGSWVSSSYLSYGRFDAASPAGHLGNWVYNNVASANGAYQNSRARECRSNLHTSVLTTGFVVPQYYSDYFVEDASFLRVDNITLATRSPIAASRCECSPGAERVHHHRLRRRRSDGGAERPRQQHLPPRPAPSPPA